METLKTAGETLKPGDKVRLKKLENWITPQDAAMTVKHIGDYSALGVAYGALCEWGNKRGYSLEKVYSLDDIVSL
jgi:effector-binding domain-containing protein